MMQDIKLYPNNQWKYARTIAEGQHYEHFRSELGKHGFSYCTPVWYSVVSAQCN